MLLDYKLCMAWYQDSFCFILLPPSRGEPSSRYAICSITKMQMDTLAWEPVAFDCGMEESDWPMVPAVPWQGYRRSSLWVHKLACSTSWPVLGGAVLGLGCQLSNAFAGSYHQIMLQQPHPFSGLIKIWICPRSQLESLAHLSCSNLDICTVIGGMTEAFP